MCAFGHSGILFGVVLDPLLRLLHHALGRDDVLRAYADDISLVVASWRTCLPQIDTMVFVIQ